MSKLHKINRKSSPSHRDSARRLLEQLDKKNRKRVLLQKKARQLLAAAKNQEVIDAFKAKKPLKGINFETDGKTFKLFGHPIAKHVKGGIAVSDAGFPTPKTFDTLRALGVNVRHQKGIISIDGKPVESDTFNTVPIKNVQPSKVFFSSPEERARMKERNKKRGSQSIVEQRKFREDTRELSTGSRKGIPFSPTQIQPHDQREINKITGIKTPLGKPIRGTEQHHILFKEKFPGLRNNPANAIPQAPLEHDELHALNPASNFRSNRKAKQFYIAQELQRIARPLDRSPEAQAERVFPLDKREFAFFDEEFSDIGDDLGRVAPVRVDTFSKFPELDKRTRNISRPVNRKRGSAGSIHGIESPLGKRIEDLTINRRLNKERGQGETFAEEFLRKFSNVKTDNPDAIQRQIGTIDLPTARKLAKLKSKLAGINPLIRKKKTGTVKKKIPVKKAMIQTAKHLSADAIVDKFLKSGIDIKGLNGVYDPIQNRVLDATIPSDKARIQELFESGDKQIGFNSITDTRSGPNTDAERVRKELREIEARGGIPSLGFDNGSLEANDTVIGDADTIMSKLLDTQRSTGIVSPDAELEIRDNPRFTGNT